MTAHTLTRLGSVACAAAVLSLAGTASADENIFGYAYGAETLPKGKWEIYSWNTARLDKGKGHYNAFDFKQEIEFGVTDRFQMSLYFNERYHDFSPDALEEEGEEGEELESSKGLHRFAYEGNQLSFKYAVLSPFKDPVGLAFYIEPGYSLVHKVTGEKVTELELEAKIILQKNFFEDQLITTLNLTAEFEWERARPANGEEYNGEMIWEVTGGISYRVARNWYVGVEGRYHTEFPNMDVNNQEHWAIFIGPNIHYGAERWWATLTWLPQVAGWPNDDERSSSLHFGEHERNEIRLKVGYNF
jgi:opacity protein-like surface antigen